MRLRRCWRDFDQEDLLEEVCEDKEEYLTILEEV